MLGSGDLQQRKYLNIPKKLPERQLSIGNDEGKLIFKCYHPETGSCISSLFKDKRVNKIYDWRKKKISRLAKIIGDPLKKLSDKEALKLIQDVNKVLQHEVYREKNNKDNPGAVLSIPDKLSAIIIGDLHTRLDNLLSVLSQNNFLEALEEGKACLIILGDAVHPEIEGKYDEMESSMLIMDIIFKLKLHFPKNVFYICGNHDSFSEEIGKMGVPQGLLWAKQLVKSRGKSYKKEMQNFYDNLAFLAYSKNYITCHASPPTSAFNLHALININQYPKTTDNLKKMIALAKQRDIKVVMLGVPIFSILSLDSAEFYEQVATEEGVPINLDVLPEILSDNKLKSDRIHPNKQGYQMMAEAVYQLLIDSGVLIPSSNDG